MPTLTEKHCAIMMALPKDSGSDASHSDRIDEVSNDAALLFYDEEQEDYVQYLSSVEDGALIKLLDVPGIITENIAEYSCGLIKQCLNGLCDAEIAVLRGKFRVDRVSQKFKHKHKVCWEKNGVYCQQCSLLKSMKDL